MGWCPPVWAASPEKCSWTRDISTKSMHSFARFLLTVFLLGACAVRADAQSGDVRVAPELPADEPVFRSVAAARYHALLEQDVVVSNSPAAAADDLRAV